MRFSSKFPSLVLSSAIAIGLTFVCAFSLKAEDPSLSLNTTSFLNLQGGDTFSFSLLLVNPDAFLIAGFNFTLESSAGSVFELDSRSYPTVISDPNSFPTLPNFAITTSPSSDLGATSNFVDNVSGTGVVVATFNFQLTASVLPGTYSLTFKGPGLDGVPTLTDTSFENYNNPSVLTVTVSVVPEPTTGILLLGGLGSLLALSHRRRTVRHAL